MKKLKFPEDFFAYDNPDCPDKDIEKAVNRMKNWMKGETYKSNPWGHWTSRSRWRPSSSKNACGCEVITCGRKYRIFTI